MLMNFSSAMERHPRISSERGEVAVISRNFPRHRVGGPYVLVPQNGWPWAGPKRGAAERARLLALRTASAASMRMATGVIRVGPSIPDIGRTHPAFLSNRLDAGFEEALEGVHGTVSPSGSPYIVSIGSMNSYRGLETLVQAYAAYRRQGGRTTLLIGGAGKEHYVRSIARLCDGIEGIRLQAHGYPRHECLTLLHHARIAVLPSHVEASPFALLEALAVQPHVAASDIPGHRAIVPAGTAHPCYFSHAEPESLTALLHAADVDDGVGGVHPLSSAHFRADERERWGDSLLSMLDTLTEEAS